MIAFAKWRWGLLALPILIPLGIWKWRGWQYQKRLQATGVTGFFHKRVFGEYVSFYFGDRCFFVIPPHETWIANPAFQRYPKSKIVPMICHGKLTVEVVSGWEPAGTKGPDSPIILKVDEVWGTYVAQGLWYQKADSSACQVELKGTEKVSCTEIISYCNRADKYLDLLLQRLRPCHKDYRCNRNYKDCIYAKQALELVRSTFDLTAK